MRFLLDTHALLWWFTDDAHLSIPARNAIANTDNEILVSAASAWEIAVKHQLGKLAQGREVIERFDELLAADGFTRLPITHQHALRAGSIHPTHRDPFDRMLAAQSHMENAQLISCDPAIIALGIDPLW